MADKTLVDYINDVEISKQLYLECKSHCEPNETNPELEEKRLAYMQQLGNLDTYIISHPFLNCIKLLKGINYI